MACITRNYTYCATSGRCISGVEICDIDTTSYTNTTGCPVDSSCTDFGFNGVGYLGDTGIKGGFSVNDSSGINAPPGNPCAIALFNTKKLDLDVALTGLGVRSYMMKVTFPFN